MENLFNENEALALIRDGLQSGAIKLLGTNNSNPKGSGERDAEYLLTLYTRLQQGFQGGQSS